MPSPKRRAKTIRDPLDPAEIVELIAGGPPPGESSVFASPSALLTARAALRLVAPTFDPLTRWDYERAAGHVAFRRHLAAGHPRGTTAAVDVTKCPSCTYEPLLAV